MTDTDRINELLRHAGPGWCVAVADDREVLRDRLVEFLELHVWADFDDSEKRIAFDNLCERTAMVLERRAPSPAPDLPETASLGLGATTEGGGLTDDD